VRDDSAARFSVLITARMQPYAVDQWGRPIGGSGTFGSIMIGTGSMGGMFGMGMAWAFRHRASTATRSAC